MLADVLQAICSWPVTMAVVLMFGLWLFRNPIAELISRIKKVHGLRGTVAEMSPSQPEHDPAGAGEIEISESVADPPPTVEDTKPLHEQVTALRNLYVNEHMNARLWEYRYLNHFLAATTQKVLDWLAGYENGALRALFDNFWREIGTEQRQIILGVLAEHSLISSSGQLVLITPKGQEYREWRGPLPRPSADA